MEIGLFIVVALCLLAAGGLTYFLVRSDRRDDAELLSPPPKIDLPGRTKSTQQVPSAPATDDLRETQADGSAPYLEPPPVLRPTFFDRLSKARSAFTGYLGGLVGLGKLSDDDWETLEEALIRADVGVKTSMRLIEDVRTSAKNAGAEDGSAILGLLKERMRAEISGGDRGLTIKPDTTNVWLFVGVNGVGKTTTIGKLGKRLAAEGHTPLMAAGDTFRAAAAEQLTMWAERAGSEIVRGNEGGDPSSVIFDGVEAAAARGCNIVLADTAGRLQNKTNLMEELSKVRRVAEKGVGEVTETLLVIDATTGQNGMSQAKIFAEAVDVTGVILTKLDGSAKGGIVFAIESELGIPVKLVGLGEQVDDLVDFDPNEFVDALFE
jgi:fused signal recognition particle receptor